MSEQPVLQLPDRPNFMVINGESYLLDKVDVSPQSMFKLVEEHYKTHLEQLKETVEQHITAAAVQDLDEQVQRIERHLGNGLIALPDELRTSGTVMTLWNNRVYPTRVLLFRPTRISIVAGKIKDVLMYIECDITRREAERYTKFIEWGKPLLEHYQGLNQDLYRIKVDIYINQDLVVVPVTASLIVDENRIQVFPKEEHCHVYPEGKLCTGNTSANVFWADDGFNDNFNSINPHSFANSACVAAQDWRSMLKNQYFLEGRVRETEGAWRV